MRNTIYLYKYMFLHMHIYFSLEVIFYSFLVKQKSPSSSGFMEISWLIYTTLTFGTFLLVPEPNEKIDKALQSRFNNNILR